MIESKRAIGELFANCRLPVVAVALAIGLSGCSFSMSLPSFLHDDETGSIKLQRATLSDQIDDADWQIARPALVKALGAVGADPPVAWSNPASGRGGLFQSVGLSFERDGAPCRAFVAGISASDAKSMVQGVGCIRGPGEVALDNVRPWKGS